MQYRTHDNGPLTTISIIPGAVIVSMEYDSPGCFTPMHDHTFDHELECVRGLARVVIDDIETIVKAGDRYTVEAGKLHSVWSLATDTLLRCVHNHADIHPNGATDGIPLEWLRRLTRNEATA